MKELNMKNFFIGFLFTLFLTRYVYLKYIGYSHPGYMLTSSPRSDFELTDADAEIVNLITFIEIASACMSKKAYYTLLNHELITDVDREAFNTLVRLGICEEHAQFVCNYFLAQNMKYPGDLIVLSSQTPLYIYNPDYLPPQNTIGLQIYELWKVENHEIIGDKKKIYYFVE